MLPLLALISSGASLVDGLGSVNAIDRLELMVDPATSDLADFTGEPRFLPLKEDDSSDLMSSRTLNDFHIEHDTMVNQLTPQDVSSPTAPADMAKNAVVQQSPVGDQSFPLWSREPGITYSEFATWLGSVNQFAGISHAAPSQLFSCDAGYLLPDRIVGRSIYPGMIDDRLTHWLDDRVTDACQSALDVEPPDRCVTAFEQPYKLQVGELSTEELRQNWSGLAELLRGGMIVVGLSEPHDTDTRHSGRLGIHRGNASWAREATKRAIQPFGLHAIERRIHLACPMEHSP